MDDWKETLRESELKSLLTELLENSQPKKGVTFMDWFKLVTKVRKAIGE